MKTFLAALAFAAATAAPPSLAGADLNNDGRADVLWRNQSTGVVYRMLMDGSTVTSGAVLHVEPDTAWRIAGKGDFDGNGTSDLLWHHDVTGQAYIMFLGANGLVSGGGMFYAEPDTAWRIAQTPDIDGDGKADILWWNRQTGQVYAMLMDGLTIKAQGMVYAEPDTQWRIVATGDFAGSGKRNQVLWRNFTTGVVYMMTLTYNAGVFSQTGQQIWQGGENVTIVGTGDLNGDGKTDIVWQYQSLDRSGFDGAVYGLFMNGPTIVVQRQLVYEGAPFRIVDVADLDGDGKADLVWRDLSWTASNNPQGATGWARVIDLDPVPSTRYATFHVEPDGAWRVVGTSDLTDDDRIPDVPNTYQQLAQRIGYIQVMSCDTNPKVNCPNGTPAPVDYVIQKDQYKPVTLGSGGAFSFVPYIAANAPNINADYTHPDTGPIKCSLQVTLSPSLPPISAVATLYAEHSGGTVNRASIQISPPDFAYASYEWVGSQPFGCYQVVADLKAALKPIMESRIQAAVGAKRFCGAPGPDLIDSSRFDRSRFCAP